VITVHTRSVLGPGSAWVLDGLSATIGSSVSSKLAQPHTLNLTTTQAASICTVWSSARCCSAGSLPVITVARAAAGAPGRGPSELHSLTMCRADGPASLGSAPGRARDCPAG
jgi:hypothetical protein